MFIYRKYFGCLGEDAKARRSRGDALCRFAQAGGTGELSPHFGSRSRRCDLRRAATRSGHTGRNDRKMTGSLFSFAPTEHMFTQPRATPWGSLRMRGMLGPTGQRIASFRENCWPFGPLRKSRQFSPCPVLVGLCYTCPTLLICPEGIFGADTFPREGR
jgi:hypothetical protein